MRLALYLALFTLTTVFFSCRKDFEYSPGDGKLEFSRDTVFLDTVFTNIGSATHALKVYNRSNNDLLIPLVRLEGGDGSSYRLNVDGQAGTVFRDVPILARDSMYVFVETTFDIGPLDADSYLYTDAIVFDNGPREQRVPLVTLVKDAIFLYPGLDMDGNRQRIQLISEREGAPKDVPGFQLQDSQLIFGNEKPYVIYGYAMASKGQHVQVAAGARLYFHKDSGMYLADGATLSVEGRLSQDPALMEGEAVFQGDRLESGFRDVAGQWDGIWLGIGSGPHQLEYVSVLNATVGLFTEGQDPESLLLRNARILNSSKVNLWCANSGALGENLVLGNAGEAALLCEGAGPYTFRHCTIANFWSQGARMGPAVQLSAMPGAKPHQSQFINSIVEGNNARELQFYGNENNFATSFSHCILRFEDNAGSYAGNPLYDFTDPQKYGNTLLNPTSGFYDTARQDFRIGLESDAIGNADPQEAQSVPLDLAGEDRSANPDIGAYQAKERNEIVIGGTKM
jgi:hypothetical protein